MVMELLGIYFNAHVTSWTGLRSLSCYNVDFNVPCVRDGTWLCYNHTARAPLSQTIKTLEGDVTSRTA